MVAAGAIEFFSVEAAVMKNNLLLRWIETLIWISLVAAWIIPLFK